MNVWNIRPEYIDMLALLPPKEVRRMLTIIEKNQIRDIYNKVAEYKWLIDILDKNN